MTDDQFKTWMRDRGYALQPDGTWGKPGSPRNQGNVPCPQFQEHEEGDPRSKLRQDADLDRPKSKTVDGTGNQKFRLTVVFKMSDNRPRDLDGGLSTICDCLIAARRQLESHSRNKHKSSES